MIREGDKRKSILTGKVYKVKAIKDWFVVLGSLDGSSHVITERDNLKLFYEKVEDEESPNNFGFSPTAAPKPLRSPSMIIIDFL